MKKFPRCQRVTIRQQIANATGVSEMAVRHWCNGIRQIPSERILAIEEITQGDVTCYDMLPPKKEG